MKDDMIVDETVSLDVGENTEDAVRKFDAWASWCVVRSVRLSVKIPLIRPNCLPKVDGRTMRLESVKALSEWIVDSSIS